MKAMQLTEDSMISPQLVPEDFAALAAQGVRMVVNDRPDNEEPGQLPAAVAARSAAEHGIAYRPIPVMFATITQDDIERFAEARAEAGGPVHAYCKAGVRSATLWALNEVLAGRMPQVQAQDYGRERGLDPSAGLACLDRRQAGAQAGTGP